MIKLAISVLVVFIILGTIHSVDGFISIKKYKVINSEKVCGDKLCSEVDEKIAKKGESSRDIKICGDRLCSDFSADPSPFNKSSPFGQLKLGIAIDLIQCKEGQQIVLKKMNDIPVCVDSDSVDKLRQKQWAMSEEEQNDVFAQIAADRRIGIESSKTLDDFDVGITITPDEINNERYLTFDGYGWHRLHNVEITITGDSFSESIRTQADDNGHIYMPWPIPDTVGGRVYDIFATDGKHDFQISIPIAPKSTPVSPTGGNTRCDVVMTPIDWSGCNLYGKIMDNVDLREANLRGANMFGVTLQGQNLSGADLTGASLKKGNLDGAIMIGTNLSHVNLVDTKIRNADLSFAKFNFAKLHRTDLTQSNLTSADFQDATMSYSILASTDLKNANLDGAGTWAANLNNCINHPICN